MQPPQQLFVYTLAVVTQNAVFLDAQDSSKDGYCSQEGSIDDKLSPSA